VIQLGACDDKQTAADTAKLSATAYTGAATYTFIQAIERYGSNQTYASLLAHMTEALAGLGKSSVQNASAGSSAVSAGLPLVGCLALGPLGLLAGAQLAAFSSEQGGQGIHLGLVCSNITDMKFTLTPQLCTIVGAATQAEG
jgi:hypothetical protein